MKFYQVDSFTDELFKGNPAGVCLIDGDSWLDDSLMQNISMENNLSETAFVLNKGGKHHIRWFTPTVEVPLCGHATLASAHILLESDGEITFHAGEMQLSVTRTGDMLTLDFPIDKIWQLELNDMLDCFDFKPIEVWRGTEEYILVAETEEQVENAICNLPKAAKIDLAGIIITAPSSQSGIDYVSRYFAPKIGIDEDPVTGSNQCLLAPLWQGKLQKSEFTALQVSKRGGKLWVKIEGGRVKIGGHAVTYLNGELKIGT
ncbi:MAG: PhzF family phenazine biosynthesis protein [Defluviitaleaceae bacterium]|nr:PhzF family phenazine biosynthesis protein [Defluviitaleaceae bacterium]